MYTLQDLPYFEVENHQRWDFVWPNYFWLELRLWKFKRTPSCRRDVSFNLYGKCSRHTLGCPKYDAANHYNLSLSPGVGCLCLVDFIRTEIVDFTFLLGPRLLVMFYPKLEYNHKHINNLNLFSGAVSTLMGDRS